MISYLTKFDPGLISTFLTVADAGKISQAAKVLHLSQPAVTAQMRKLEATLGARLFERSIGGVALTPEGRRFYDQARKVFALLDEIAREFSENSEIGGQLTVFASTTIASHVLPPILAQFRLRHPQVGIELCARNTEEVLRGVSAGEAPLGLVEGVARASRVRLEPFLDDELVLIASSRFSSSVSRLSDLARHPLLWREQGSGSRAVIERALRKSGWKRSQFDYSIRLGNTEAIKAGVMAGLGVAFVSRWSIQSELALGKLKVIPMADFRLVRKFHWVLPSGHLPKLVLEFYRFATSSMR